MVQAKTENYKVDSVDVVIVADYGDMLAPAEVARRLRQYDKNNRIKQIDTVNVPNFNTLATGFVIGQLGLQNAHQNLVIFSNTAPRGKSFSDKTDKTIPWEGNQNQAFVFARLRTGVPVFFVHSGYAGAAIKESITDFREVNVSNEGTQFRSRDSYAGAVAGFINGKTSIIGKDMDIDSIPHLPGERIAYIDGYGNIKTTIRKSDWPKDLGDKTQVEVEINGVKRTVMNMVGIKGQRLNGGLYVQTGSSGEAENPYIEIVRIMGSAEEAFKIGKNYNENLEVSIRGKG